MKRYNIPIVIEYNGIEEDPEGEWVKWDDVKDAGLYCDHIIESNPQWAWPNYAQKLPPKVEETEK